MLSRVNETRRVHSTSAFGTCKHNCIIVVYRLILDPRDRQLRPYYLTFRASKCCYAQANANRMSSYTDLFFTLNIHNDWVFPPKAFC